MTVGFAALADTLRAAQSYVELDIIQDGSRKQA